MKTSKSSRWAKNLNRHFLKEGIQTINWCLKKMPNITNHQEMQIKCALHTTYWNGCYWKKWMLTSAGKDVENTTALYILSGNVN
jgi:hypothetical protein